MEKVCSDNFLCMLANCFAKIFHCQSHSLLCAFIHSISQNHVIDMPNFHRMCGFEFSHVVGFSAINKGQLSTALHAL